MNATDAMGEGDRTEGNPSPEDGAADGVRFVRNRADKDSRARFSLGRAFSCAWEGVVYTARTQRNMKIHFAVGAAAVLLGAALGIDAASWAAIVICIVLGGLMSLVAHLFPQIYNTSDSIRGLAAAFIRICALCMPINALANACYFTLRSGGKTFVTFLFDSFYVCVLTVPMAFVLSRFTGLPIVPLFLCCQLADIGKCVVGLIMIRRGVWIQNIVGKEAA